jgi:hypothetical protein
MRRSTLGGTISEISPPNLAASLMMDELVKIHRMPVMRKTVSTSPIKFSVHQRQLELILEIGDRPHPPENGLCLSFARIIHRQPVKGVKFDAFNSGHGFIQHFQPLFHGEKGFFPGLCKIAMMTRSNRQQPLLAISMCPLVTGSKEPG